MEPITQKDLDTIQLYAKQVPEDSSYKKLTSIYSKLDHLCKQICKKGFEYTIRKDPRKVAGTNITFREYQWAKIYPKGLKSSCKKHFAYVVGLSDSLHFHMMGVGEYQSHKPSKDASNKCWTEIDLDDFTYDSIAEEFVKFDKKYKPLFIKTGAAFGINSCIKLNQQMKNQQVSKLLLEKKQIILQGPPGTGKTRLAKQIAKQIINISETSYSFESVNKVLTIGLKIPNSSGVADYYTVKETKEASVILTSERATQDWEPQFSEILKKLVELEQGIIPENKKGLNPYELAVAKYLYKNISLPTIQDEQMELIQFHPSYTYEDFVRGIEAKGSDKGVEYKTVDKVLSKLAKKANDNWNDFHSNPEDLRKKEWIENKFSEYLSNYSELLASSKDNKVMLTESIYIYQVEEDCFRYKGDVWASPSRINFSELKELISHNIDDHENFNIPKSISNHAFYRRSYYGSILNSFFKFSGVYSSNITRSPVLKNYVLIIDEINRANLPSVLGELIYALEYRGEPVNSMYEINQSSKITLPKNLFIIGTMNTADRSVGHIDYAIRRRFAFVDVLPNDDAIPTPEGKELFQKVSDLFVNKEEESPKPSEHLSPDFNFKEVQIGHSYFICSVDKLSFRLDYEIKPILREYLKDGILMSTAEDIIESLTI